MAGPRWVRIDTSYLRNPKITAISAQAVLLHLSSILWTGDQLTDGEIPDRTLTELAQHARISRRALPERIDELVGGRLWVPNGHPDSRTVHDFTTMNSQATRAAVEKQRAKWRKWQDEHRKS